MKYLLVLCLPLMGCIHAPAHSVGYGGAAPNPAAVSSCETTRTWHNIWTIAGSIFGAAAGAQGTAEGFVQDNKGLQTGISIGVAGSGVLGAISATAAGIEADTYSQHNCQTLLSQEFTTSP